ncbi:hypothetical protein [Gimesia panareensis]|uniref:Uncharacterized protein n=1 Tax=Gimesia panareensis TaxID=2527978 RepID=A0A517Q6K9_9PLAN|nr:hypothetical protein [Gimesia panareensis]QDT27272.1 hypothetical protein Enr10x_25880 [Gimesia panareensis]QDU49879.1 hypothetical protein Pan110_22190 [Gimesia panareensis]QDV16840.1 hypothetical protein Pan153_14730 [Gimesia panareensis]
MKLLRQLWSDECGNVSAFSTVLIMTILVIGFIPGVVTIRDHVVQGFGDIAEALVSLDQSYSFTINGVTSEYIDTNSGGMANNGTLVDEGTVAPAAMDAGDGSAPAALDLTIPAATGE